MHSPLPINIMVGPGAPSVTELRDAGVIRVTAGTALAEVAYSLVERAATELLAHGTYTTLEPGGLFRNINGAFVPG
jgi:2-methylisocitrate lyase-like PEP mutase family enzyme